jgi:hypothetical protein
MQQIPYLPKSGMWSGFALTNPDNVSQEGIVLATYDGEGYPIQTVLGPVDLQAGEKRVFFFNDLPWRRHEYATSERLVLFSQRPVGLLNLLGSANSKMAAFVQGRNKGSHLVIPDVESFMSTDQSMTGAVINESVRETEVRIRVYAEDGDFKREVDVPLGRGEKLPIMPGSSPFYSLPSEGWIDIEAEGDNQISGCQSLISAQAFETMFALPVRTGRRIIPHVPLPGRWMTRVTLVNPNDAENRIVFHPALAGGDSAEDLAIILGPYEKKEFEIQEWFGWQSGDVLFQSLIEVEGERPFVGYYSYAASSGLGDEASFPLLDESDFDTELILPHFPGTALGYWWTGIGLFNPTLYEVVIGVEAYDDQGERVETAISTLRLDPGAYEVMLVRSIGGDRASEISFVKFVVRDLGGVIGGFYLYGHNAEDGTMLSLSGANM